MGKLLCLVVMVGQSACALEEGPEVGEVDVGVIIENELQGYTDKYTREDNNRCLPDVGPAASGMRLQGELMGMRLGDGHPGLCAPALDCFEDYHVQGFSRFAPITTAAGTDYSLTDYFVMTSNHEDHARFAIVRLASGASNGLRIKGNKSAVGDQDWDNPPPTNDNMIIVQAVHPDYVHPGGVNTLGRYFVTAVEEEGPAPGEIVLHYMPPTLNPATCTIPTDPSCPQERWSMVVSQPPPFATGLKVRAQGEAGHRYLWVTANPDSRTVRFILTAQNQSLDVPPTISDIYELSVTTPPWPSGMAYQNMTLVSQCSDGQLWLFGLHGDGSSDWIDAWHLNLIVINGVISSASNMGLAVRRVLDKREGGHFHAGHSVYIDPVGHLLAYVTEKYDADPALLNGAVRFAEYRMNSHLFPRESPYSSGECSNVNDAYVELLADRVGTGAVGDSPNTVPQESQSYHAFMIDYTKRNARTYSNFGTAYNYNDRASSVRYCIPAGKKYVLFRDANYLNPGFVARGSSTDYVGSSTAGTVSNGWTRAWNFGSNSDEFSSGCFMNSSRQLVGSNCCTSTCP